jgi:hypothetical protein
MEAANARYRRNLAEAENRISALEVRLKHAGQSGDGGPRGDELDKLDRVMSIRREASELQTGLLRVRQTLEEGR